MDHDQAVKAILKAGAAFVVTMFVALFFVDFLKDKMPY